MTRRPTLTLLSSLAASVLAIGAPEGENLDGPPSMLARIPRAEWLVSQGSCTACHTAPTEFEVRAPQRLGPMFNGQNELGARATTDWIQAFLAEPERHGAGPDLTSGLEEDERNALAHFLMSRGTPTPKTRHTATELEAGRRLYHTIGCVACHAPMEEAWERDLPYWFAAEQENQGNDADADATGRDARFLAPGTFAPLSIPMRDLADRHTVASLSRYLANPLDFDPAAGMPDFALTASEARSLAVYLLREQALDGRRVPEGQPGLAFERFDDVSGSTIPDFDALEANETGVVLDANEFPEHPDDNFGLRYNGLIEVPADGQWTFGLTSDDGSRLEVDGRLVVDNDGLHGAEREGGTVELTAGLHALRIDYWEQGGDETLEFDWAGPGVEPDLVPPTALSHEPLQYRGSDVSDVDEELRRRGSQVYVELGCAACHEPDRARASAPTFAALAGSSDIAARGCLTESFQRGVPRYGWSGEDREAIRAFLGATKSWSEPLEPAAELERALVRSACFACHRRDEWGGPHPDRAEYFHPSGDFDLGEEGRIPPHLTLVGAKLTSTALDNILSGDHRVRPYVATRMPRFAPQRVAALTDLFATVDDPLPWSPPAISASPNELRTIGRQLVGTKNGLGCIQCHRFQGTPSLGIQAVDLSLAQSRLRPAWLANLLLDPDAVQMNSRMPSFWEGELSPVDVFDRDPRSQVAAILAYLEDGESASPPPGLVTPDSVYELETEEGTRTVSVFMRDVSPRAQLIGSPIGIHLAFDAQHSRLARIWTGRFFNAKGTWEGRAGGLEDPTGRVTLDLPPGPPVGRIDMPRGEWPATAKRLGQTYDDTGRPSWRYRVEDISVSESTQPFEEPDGSVGLRRRLELETTGETDGVFVRLHADLDTAGFEVSVPETSESPAVLVERSSNGRREQLLMPRWEGTHTSVRATVELEYRW